MRPVWPKQQLAQGVRFGWAFNLPRVAQGLVLHCRVSLPNRRDVRVIAVRAHFYARLETSSFEDGLARNAHRVSSAIWRNFGCNFAQLGRKSVQPSAISTIAQLLVTTLAPSRWLPETFRAFFMRKTFEHKYLYQLNQLGLQESFS